jgi:hypothetical protein
VHMEDSELVRRLESRTAHSDDIALPLRRRVGEMEVIFFTEYSLSTVKTLSGGSAQGVGGCSRTLK